MARQGNNSAERAAIVARFDELADLIERRWPDHSHELRLPSPRDGVVVVEIPLSTLEGIVQTALIYSP